MPLWPRGQVLAKEHKGLEFDPRTGRPGGRLKNPRH